MLFNGDFVNDQARHLARRLRRECGADAERQVEEAYRLLLCRRPTDAEKAALFSFVKQHASRHTDPEGEPARFEAMKLACRVLLNLNEFVYAD